MKHLLKLIALVMITTINSTIAQTGITKVKLLEQQLDDVMEITDTTLLKEKLKEVEASYELKTDELNKLRLGIIYHETALNFSFLSKTNFMGYAKKSFDVLSELLNSPTTSIDLLPFISSYRASALSLVSAETKKLNLLGEAFSLFKETVTNYSEVSYLPEFLRGSVAENLPTFFFRKRKSAKKDFYNIILKYEKNTNYANGKVMSFTYWAWAKQHQAKKYRKQALLYLDAAIHLDPTYKAGRKRAEILKKQLTYNNSTN